MNPESLCQPVLKEATDYKEAVKVALTFQSSELVKEQVQKGKELKAKIREAKAKLDDEIGHLEAWKRTLSVASAYLSADADKLEDYFWSVLHDEKEATR